MLLADEMGLGKTLQASSSCLYASVYLFIS